MAQKNKGVWWRKYKWQLNGAKERGIPWHFTFEEWCEIWRDSGKWHQRGRHTGQYCMARYHDRGPYAWWNVRICLVGENVNEMRSFLPERSRRGREADLAANRNYKRKQREGSLYVRPEMAKSMIGYRIVIRDGKRRRAYPGDQDYPG